MATLEIETVNTPTVSVGVLRSADLKTWTTVGTVKDPEGTNAFYRLANPVP